MAASLARPQTPSPSPSSSLLPPPPRAQSLNGHLHLGFAVPRQDQPRARGHADWTRRRSSHTPVTAHARAQAHAHAHAHAHSHPHPHSHPHTHARPSSPNRPPRRPPSPHPHAPPSRLTSTTASLIERIERFRQARPRTAAHGHPSLDPAYTRAQRNQDRPGSSAALSPPASASAAPSASAHHTRRSAFRLAFARYTSPPGQLHPDDTLPLVHPSTSSSSSSSLSSPSYLPANESSSTDSPSSPSSSSSHYSRSRPPTNRARSHPAALASPDAEATAHPPALRGPSPSPTASPAMHSMTRTHSSGGVNGGSGSAGSALGRMFRRYSHGQHGQGRSQPNTPAAPSSASMDQHYSRGASTLASSPARPTTAAPASGSTHSAAAAANRAPSSSTHLPSVAADGGLVPGLETLPGAIAATTTTDTSPTGSTSAAVAAMPGTSPSPQSGVHRIRLVPHLEATRSLHFEPIERDLREGVPAVKIGRFTDRVPAAGASDDARSAAAGSTLSQPIGSGPGNRGGAVPSSAGGGGRIDSARIAFKSKVVSRGHAELWCEPGGKFFIRDTKSSSGTFLNHIRLSAPNVESKPHAIKDGDILQLGVDYQGGTEEIYRCVKIRVELNRGWQREANQFNVNALRQLRALQGSPMLSASGHSHDAAQTASALPTNRQAVNVTDCCICLFSVTVCQALFIAPCSHVYHYKCIRPMLNLHHPGFSCPLCRTFADLEADVEQDEEWQEALVKEAEAAETARLQGSSTTEPSTPQVERQLDELHRAAAPESGLPASATAASLNAPSVPSGLRQQLAVSDRPTTADRPGTAVGDDPGPGALGRFDSFSSLVAPLPEEETQEVMRDPSDTQTATRRAYPRISEEGSEGDLVSPAAPSDARPEGQRRGSQPIDIRASASSAGGTGADSSDFSGFSPLEESRTPVNQHVLSVLAEAPPRRASTALGPPPSGLSNVAFATGDQTLTSATTGTGMPSLGASSTRLAVDEQQGGERRASIVSEDAGFRTPGESSSQDHQHTARRLSSQQGYPQVDGSAEGSSGSHRASPSPPQMRDPVETSRGASDTLDGEQGSSGARSTALASPAAKSLRDPRKRDTSVQSRDSQGSSIDTGRANGGGKMKMFLKKAAGV